MRSKRMKPVLLYVFSCIAALSIPSWAAPGDIIWSQDFNSYSVGTFVGQDPCWAFVNAGGVADVAWIYDDLGNLYLSMGTKSPSTGGNTWYWAIRNLGGEITATSSDIAIDLDVTPLFSPTAWLGQQFIFYVMDGTDRVIASLLLRNNSYTGTYLFNDIDLGEPSWSAHRVNHYRIEIDFAADTASLYIAYALEPRLTAALSEDFSVGDLAKIQLGIGGYYNSNQTAYVNLDNVKITDNTQRICPQGDASGDCRVDLEDFALMSNYWQVVGDLDPNDPNFL